VHFLLPGDAFFQGLTVRRHALVGGVVNANFGRQIGFEPVAERGAKSGSSGLSAKSMATNPSPLPISTRYLLR
jgi:hypothetical protein